MIYRVSKTHRYLYVRIKVEFVLILYEDERKELPVRGELVLCVDELQIILALPFDAVDVSVTTIGPIGTAVEA